MTQALEGLRVVELAGHLPTQYTTMWLADFGAEVIKVEAPSPRHYHSSVDLQRRALLFDRNKRSLNLNLKVKSGKEWFYRLIETTDVVLECYRPGTTKKLGVDYQALSKVNPRLIYCSLTGYGQDGPYRDLVGHDINYLALGGWVDLIGDSKGMPVVPPMLLADLAAAGLFALIGVLLAVHARERTGKGQYIDSAIFDSVVSLLIGVVGDPLGGALRRGGLIYSGGVVPCYGLYQTADGEYLALGVLEPHFWRNLCRVLGREDLVDSQYATGAEGQQAMAVLQDIFRAKSRSEWFELLRDEEISCSPVNHFDEVVRDPQVRHRELLVETDHPTGGRIIQFGVPIKLSDTPGTIRTTSPGAGQDTDVILADLGCGAEEIEQLRREGAI